MATIETALISASPNGGSDPSSGRCLKDMAEKNAPPNRKLTRAAKNTGWAMNMLWHGGWTVTQRTLGQ
jgi:hypothetical protein